MNCQETYRYLARGLVCALCFSSAPTLSQDAAARDAVAAPHPAHRDDVRSSAHSSGHSAHHVFGVFLGDTMDSRREGVTLGLEYEYRPTERLGVGATVEHVAGDFHTDVYVLPVAYHQGPWKFYAGPGLERGEEGDEKLLRLGVEYGFEAGRFEISPQIDVDFVDGERLFVVGVVFALPF